MSMRNIPVTKCLYRSFILISKGGLEDVELDQELQDQKAGTSSYSILLLWKISKYRKIVQGTHQLDSIIANISLYLLYKYLVIHLFPSKFFFFLLHFKVSYRYQYSSTVHFSLHANNW